MHEQEWIEQLKQEGFVDVRVCPLPPASETPEHTHNEHTVHIILSDELIITDAAGTTTYRPGDRMEFPVGTTHKAKSAKGGESMIIGVKRMSSNAST